MPGEDIDETMRIVVGELPDLVHLPELPARGSGATMTGRGVAIVTELGFDLQPAGWRLTGAGSADQQRARSLLARDLDALEVHTLGYAGPLKLQVIGPWTLAATVERPRGDRVLADFGARRELAQALAEGVSAHVAEVARRMPAASIVLQVDEPSLPAVLAGRVPTASGFHRHRSVDQPVADEALRWVFDAARAAGASILAHCCAVDPPIRLLRGAGAEAMSVDFAGLGAAALDALGEILDAGNRVHLGVVASVEPRMPLRVRPVVDRVLRLCDMLGFDPAEVSDQIVLTPACGLAGASPSYAREALRTVREAAAALG
jgi:methionine synthase II (cobalamin-independent)